MATCTATRADGLPCRTPVVGSGSYCFGHDPKQAAKRTEARRRGGENRANTRRLAKLLPARLAPAFELLDGALSAVLDGTLDPKQASAAAAVARAMATILQVGELEERLRALEGGQTGGTGGRWRA